MVDFLASLTLPEQGGRQFGLVPAPPPFQLQGLGVQFGPFFLAVYGVGVDGFGQGVRRYAFLSLPTQLFSALHLFCGHASVECGGCAMQLSVSLS
ncbi:MAG: hypothetical protein ACI36X_06245 [Bacteroidaceae bacterium]